MEQKELHFIDRTVQHIRGVQDNMILLENNREKLPFEIEKWRLLQRSVYHDSTKFSNQLVDGYVIINDFYRNERLGLPNDHIDREKTRKVSELHCELETHHPDKQKEMSTVCLCEMCCDMVAMAQEKGEEDFTLYYREVQLKNYPVLEQYHEQILTTLTLLQTLNSEDIEEAVAKKELFFIKRTIQHIRRVQDNMILLEKNKERLPFEIDKWRLLQRSVYHDSTKFCNDLVDNFVLMTAFYNEELSNGEEIDKSNFEGTFKRHRCLENHHPHGKETMSNLDLYEMCSDLSAMSQEFNEEDYTEFYRTKLLKEVPMLQQYHEQIIEILQLLQTLTKEKNDNKE